MYRSCASQLDEEVRTALDQDYRTAVLDPLAKFSEFLPQVNECIKRRQKKLLDYDSHRGRVRKLAERPSEDVDKLPMVRGRALSISC